MAGLGREIPRKFYLLRPLQYWTLLFARVTENVVADGT
jgi:hypothetical protein